MFYSTGRLYIFEDKNTIYRSHTSTLDLGPKYWDAACLIKTDADDEPPLTLTSDLNLFILQVASPNPIHTKWRHRRDDVFKLVLNPPNQDEITKACVFWSPFPMRGIGLS